MTSTTASPPRPLPGWLKTTLLAGLVFALSWGGAIAYWRTADSAPATGELLLVLLAAPLALLGAAWLARKCVLARPASAAAAGTASARPAATTAPVPALAMLAAAVRVPHGDSVEELAGALAENKARPDLDPELVDDDGFPVTSARSEAAVDEVLEEDIRAWLVLNGMAEPQFGEAQWRALTLGTAVIRELANEALMQLVPAEGKPPPLRLLPLFPTGWSVEQRHAAGLWFRHTVAQCGWPLDSLTRIEVDADALPAAILAQCSGAGATTLVLACASYVEQDLVDAWAASGLLHTASRPLGRIPGEGAAGLLLSGLEAARRIEGARFAQLYPLVETRREVSADSAKRPETKRLAELAQLAVQAAGTDIGQVAAIAADTDHRSSRALELIGMASALLPELDATTDVACAGVPLGQCGAVPALAALALARHLAVAKGAPVLFVSNDDPYTCNMALVGPQPV